MIRTQIYLTETEHEELRRLSRQRGASLSELIRLAVDRFLVSARSDPAERLVLLRHGRGLWKERTDLPDFSAMRRELDRRA